MKDDEWEIKEKEKVIEVKDGGGRKGKDDDN